MSPRPAVAIALLLAGCQPPRSDIVLAVADAEAPILLERALLDVRPETFCTYETDGRYGDPSTTQRFADGRVVESVHTFDGNRVESTWSYRELPGGALETTRVEVRSGRHENRTDVTITTEDAEGRLVRERFDRKDDGEFERDTSWTFEGLTTRVEFRSPQGGWVRTTEVNEAGNLVEEVTEHDSGPTFTSRCVYDETGELPRSCESDTYDEWWTYNELGLEASYRGVGPTSSRTREWSFDDRGFPISVLDQDDERGIVLWDARLDYDDRGRVVFEDGTRHSARLDVMGPVDAVRSFAYDEQDRLTFEHIEASDGAWTATLRWDEQGRLLEYDASNNDGSGRFAHVLTYDDQGRLLTHEERQGDRRWVGRWTYDCG